MYSVIIVVVQEGRRDIMTKVVVNGNLDGALKKLKVKVARSGISSELRKHREYTKPGVKRREAKKEMIRNSRKKRRD